MNVFKKLFETKKNEVEEQQNVFKPDNTKLLKLIDNYYQDNSNENYAEVIQELYEDQAFLIVPTFNEGKTSFSKEWKTLKVGESIDFTTVFNVDGLLVFGVFTSELSLSKWIKEETSFIAMPAKTVLNIAEEQNFGRIVIDSDQETMFVLERNVNNQKREVIKEDTEILVWMPENPISGSHKKQFQEAFSKVESIKEAYHFGITKNNEHIYILALLLSPKTENAILASQGSINDGMNEHQLDFPLEIMYLDEDDDLLITAREYDLFYKKEVV